MRNKWVLENGDREYDSTKQVLRGGAGRHLRPAPSGPPRAFEGAIDCRPFG